MFMKLKIILQFYIFIFLRIAYLCFCYDIKKGNKHFQNVIFKLQKQDLSKQCLSCRHELLVYIMQFVQNFEIT